MTKLHRIIGKQRWCGSCAIAAITGITTDEAASMLREQTGRRQITGVVPAALLRCLGSLGYSTTQVFDSTVGGSPTLAEWLKQYNDQRHVYLVAATQHMLTVAGRKAADSCNRVPVFLRAFRGRQRRVCDVWRVQKEYAQRGGGNEANALG